MFLKIKIKLNRTLFFALFLFLINCGVVFSATLNFVPEGGSYKVGDIVSIKVLVSSPADAVNAVSSRIKFTQDNLSLISISKSESIISLWAQEPTFSNGAGTASFEGIALSAYTGSGANIVTLNFRANKEGSANVNFVAASVLANDGQGTNILTGTNEASFNIVPAPIKEVLPTDNKPKTPKEIIEDAITPKIDQTDPKESPIYYYVSEIDYSSIILICVWVALIFALMYLYLRYRYSTQKKLEEAKKIAQKSFQILKEDLKHNKNSLESDIYDAEKVIIDNIDDIEKI